MEAIKNIYIIDSTLRDGEQAPGVVFSEQEKIHIAQMLDGVGVDEIEAGTPAMGEDECRIIRKISAMNLSARISVWSRAVKQDILIAAKTGAQGIHIAFPLSDIQLASMNKEWAMMRDSLPEMVEIAKSYFDYVSVGAQDASRCRIERLFEFISMAEELSVRRIRFADTVGILTPMGIMDLIKKILNRYPYLDIDFHGHNDLGMATANAITAWQSGASTLSVTVNGLGERAGNSALEEVIMTMLLIEKQNKYSTSTLYSLCQYVSIAAKRPISVGKAISGNIVFSHESGIHAKSSLIDINAFQAFDGKLIGRESSRNLFGKHSGKGAVIDFLNKQHVIIDNAKIDRLMAIIHQMAQTYQRSIYGTEIIEAYWDLE
ncbi:homocitrate synthase [Dysgonomonas sp. GY75]|uniref:homocitrate synthase/isopropylmalate synthase family protein n=1 Tax=Dysgonomonas sp. GY75 TaxID=2780419 RepID=UPI0018836212|nr:homocitrate synthase [Dysgonomonas sp. GY75]MBF0649551.1 homocitrate synthase [Dysgonomonas sp. GY75]